LFFYDSFSFGVHKILGFSWRRGACKTTGAPVALEVALALHYITNWAALGTDRNRKTEHSIPCIKYTPCVFWCMNGKVMQYDWHLGDILSQPSVVFEGIFCDSTFQLGVSHLWL